MPRQQTIIDIFLASPSDLLEERQLVVKIVDEINATTTQNDGYAFRLLSWEQNAIPGFGEEPQAVINRSIGNTYDIFLGILWSRFGTPTKASESGTKEEFDLAHQRFRKDTESVKIMLYFKTSPIPQEDLDTDQWRLVSDFKAGLKDIGGLYKTFTSSDDFERQLRHHLTVTLLQYTQKTNAINKNSLKTIKSQEINDEPGLLELEDAVNVSMNESSERLKAITVLIVKLNDSTNENTKALPSIPSISHLPSSAQKSLFTQHLNKVAEIWNFFSSEISSSSTHFLNHFHDSLELMMKLIKLKNKYEMLNENDKTTFADFHNAFTQMVISNDGMLLAISKMPPFTSTIAQSKKNLITSIKNLNDDLKNCLLDIDEIAKLINP